MTDPQSPIDLNRVPQPCPYLLEYKTSIFPREFAFFIIRLNLPSELGVAGSSPAGRTLFSRAWDRLSLVPKNPPLCSCSGSNLPTSTGFYRLQQVQGNWMIQYLNILLEIRNPDRSRETDL